MHVEDYQELSPLLLRVLQQQVGLSPQEAVSSLQRYGEDSFRRWNDFEEEQEHRVQVTGEHQDTPASISDTEQT